MRKCPDRWVVVEITSPAHGTIQKVLGSWYGGYMGSDSWQMSSGITEVKEEDDRYEFINESGSIYVCYKGSMGMSGYTSGIYEDLCRKVEALNDGSTLKIIETYV